MCKMWKPDGWGEGRKMGWRVLRAIVGVEPRSRAKWFPQLGGVKWKHAITIWIRNFFFSLSRAVAGICRHPRIFSQWVSNLTVKPHRKLRHSWNQFFALGGEASSWSTPGRTYVQVCRGKEKFDCKSVFAPCRPACSFECTQAKAKTTASKRVNAMSESICDSRCGKQELAPCKLSKNCSLRQEHNFRQKKWMHNIPARG